MNQVSDYRASMAFGACENKYMQWYKSLKQIPTAKDPAGTAQMAESENIIKTDRDKYADVDKILYSGEAVQSSIKNYTGTPMTEYEICPSSQRDYTEADAVNYQYNKEFVIKLDDVMNGDYGNIKLKPNGPVPQEFIDGLRENGIKEDGYDSFWSRFYLMGLNSGDRLDDSQGLDGGADLEHGLDYLASGYAVARHNIEETFEGEEREDALNKLTTAFDQRAESIADSWALELGGFFEENGLKGETERIRGSIMKAYRDKTGAYSDFIMSETDYSGIANPQDAWLKKDNSYMACQLRKAFIAEDTADSEEYYSVGELCKTQEMVREIKSQTSGYGNHSITANTPEEEIGLKLGELVLKGQVFSQYRNVSDRLKGAVDQSIRHIKETITDRLNQTLQDTRKGSLDPGIWADMDRNAIFAVYDRIMSSYRTAGNMLEALQKGEQYARGQYDDKKTGKEYCSMVRYYGNFKYNSEALANSWNRFIIKITDDESLLMKTSELSAFA